MEVWQNSFCVLNLKRERDLNLCLVAFGLFLKLNFPSSLLLFSKTLFCDGFKKKKLVFPHRCSDMLCFEPLVQFSCSVVSNSLRPMDCGTPGFPVHYQLADLAQTHFHQVGDAIQPSHPLLSPYPPAFNLSQHQGLFQWVSSSHQTAKALELQLQHQSFQWLFRTDFL